MSMAGTLAVIIGLSTLLFTLVLSLLAVFDFIRLGILVVTFNIVQWLLSPYLVNALYHARELPKTEEPELHAMVEGLSEKSGVKPPKLMLAQIPIPNAFAYSSPIAGSRIAVTTGLLKTLSTGEVEAVIGHELGHLRHRDVQTMMFVSMLPALLSYIGYSLMFSMSSRRREGSGDLGIIGIVFMAFSWVLNLFILYLSRLREYYADRHSASIVPDGSRKLSVALVKIVQTTRNMGKARKGAKNQNAFKALFIADPDHAEMDSAEIGRLASISGEQKLVEELMTHKLTTAERLTEALSTHPNMTKRLKALQELN